VKSWEFPAGKRSGSWEMLLGYRFGKERGVLALFSSTNPHHGKTSPDTNSSQLGFVFARSGSE
jgi:hypothetical protein